MLSVAGEVARQDMLRVEPADFLWRIGFGTREDSQLARTIQVRLDNVATNLQ